MVTFTLMLGCTWFLLSLVVAVLWYFWRRHVDHKPPPRSRTQHVRPPRPVITYWPEPTDKRGWR